MKPQRTIGYGGKTGNIVGFSSENYWSSESSKTLTVSSLMVFHEMQDILIVKLKIQIYLFAL